MTVDFPIQAPERAVDRQFLHVVLLQVTDAPRRPHGHKRSPSASRATPRQVFALERRLAATGRSVGRSVDVMREAMGSRAPNESERQAFDALFADLPADEEG